MFYLNRKKREKLEKKHIKIMTHWMHFKYHWADLTVVIPCEVCCISWKSSQTP